MKQFKDDVMHWKDYDFSVINDNVEICYQTIIDYINNQKKQKRKLKYNKKPIKKHIYNLIH